MDLIDGETVFTQYLSGTIYQDTQVEPGSVSLTVNKILQVTTRGDLDFGGGELKLGSREPIDPERRDPEDDHGWWALEGGTYMMELNESVSLPEDHLAVLSPHQHLSWNGCGHPTLTLDHVDAEASQVLPLRIGGSGLAIKENARVSILRVIRF